LHRQRDTALPLSFQQQANMEAALEVVCQYASGSSGYERTYGTVFIKGRPQATGSDTTHAATVAWRAAELALDGQTDRIYMDRSLNDVLRDLGVTVAAEITGDGSRPDIIRVRKDGKLEVIEIQSASQSNGEMDTLVANIRTYLTNNCPSRLDSVNSVNWEPRTKAE